MRVLDTYSVKAVNLDKVIVYLGPTIQETIRVSSSKATRAVEKKNVSLNVW